MRSLFLLFFVSVQLFAQQSTSQLLQDLEKLKTNAAVLYIAAHPDDENTRMLAYYANEKHFRTAYLSLTRGDGGQNLIGSEQGELLGVIRTEELLAARRQDKAQQYFTRARDFGYSKNPEETFRIWNKDSILKDVVFAIRSFRPDVIILRFPTTGEGGHGHHTASAILGVEAFDAAADPKRFPEQLIYVKPWKAKRIFWNMFRPKEEEVKGQPGIYPVDLGVFNPVLGKSYGEIAAESRSMHKSQGFGAAKGRGKQVDYLKFLRGDTITTNDPFEGVTTEWGASNIRSMIGQIAMKFDPRNPSASVNDLLKLRGEIALIKDDHLRKIKTEEVNKLILDCAGVFAEVVAENYSAAPGQTVKFNSSVIARGNDDIKLYAVRFYTIDSIFNRKLVNNILYNDTFTVRPENISFSMPFWLRNRSEEGLFSINDPLSVNDPQKPNQLSAEYTFLFGKDTIRIQREAVYKFVDPVKGEIYRPFEMIPPVSIDIAEKVEMFPSSELRNISVTLTAGADKVEGIFYPGQSEGWKVVPASFNFSLKKKGDEVKFTLTITPPSGQTEGLLKPYCMVGEKKYNYTVSRIHHDHIPVQTLVRSTEIKLVRSDVATIPLSVGYITGAGDEIPASLRQMGFSVHTLTDDELTNGDLSVYDVIIAGVRAYNTNERIAVYQPRLLEYVNNGGTYLVQYNTSNFLSSVKTDIGPYPFKITRNRVTDENAEVMVNDSGSSLMNFPNKLKSDDFKGWVQERGIYFAGDINDKYQTPFSMKDPGEDLQKGSVIVASYGKGTFIYTGLAFFRQLPAGVTGSYKLFINLMSAGKANEISKR